MAKIADGRISNSEWLVILTLGRTVVHHSSTSRPTYMPNFSEIEKNFLCTHGRTHRRTFENGFIMSTLSVCRRVKYNIKFTIEWKLWSNLNNKWPKYTVTSNNDTIKEEKIKIIIIKPVLYSPTPNG